MNPILQMFRNYHLVCSLAGFLSAQVFKFILTLIAAGTLDFKKLVENGGMPSSHTSTVLALTVSLGRVLGTDSPVFAIAFILSMVVMIDAMGVRRATGENSKLLNKIIHDLFEEKNAAFLAEDLREYVGHKPLEVLVGAVIGIIIPFIIAPF
ncbi:MAG: divergent PAP2 family protein [Clostridia bacterium]|nr:divergent PAP2 family protein [Clostridia bacterium]